MSETFEDSDSKKMLFLKGPDRSKVDDPGGLNWTVQTTESGRSRVKVDGPEIKTSTVRKETIVSDFLLQIHVLMDLTRPGLYFFNHRIFVIRRNGAKNFLKKKNWVFSRQKV